MCDQDYYLTANGCLPCSEAARQTVIAGIVIVGIVLFGIGIWLYFTYSTAKDGAALKATASLLLMDRNSDGVIDAVEYLAAGGTREDFKLYDADGDNSLNIYELQEYALDEAFDDLEDNVPLNFTVNDATSLFPTDPTQLDKSDTDKQMLDGFTVENLLDGKAKSAVGMGSSNGILPEGNISSDLVDTTTQAAQTITDFFVILKETLWACE